MRRWAYALLLVVTTSNAAFAHKLKVFATVEAGTISGYGFFVGGGRPQGSTAVIKDAAGREVYRGATDSEGRFSWTPAAPSTFTVIVDTREGHVAEAVLAAERFGGAEPTPADARRSDAGATKMATAAAGDAETERRIEAAVARQVRPLLERIEALDARLRLADIVSGVGMILGLAGMGLWAVARRTAHPKPPEA